MKVIAALTDSTLDRLLQPVGWVERNETIIFRETRAIVGSIDVIDEKTQAALSQIGREEKAAAADKVSPIVDHRASIAEGDGFRCRSTHPTNYRNDRARRMG